MEGKGERKEALRKWDGIHNWESKRDMNSARKEAIKSKRIILQRGKERRKTGIILQRCFYFKKEKMVRFDLLEIKIPYILRRLIQQCKYGEYHECTIKTLSIWKHTIKQMY